jgi:hypothetical protein
VARAPAPMSRTVPRSECPFHAGKNADEQSTNLHQRFGCLPFHVISWLSASLDQLDN